MVKFIVAAGVMMAAMPLMAQQGSAEKAPVADASARAMMAQIKSDVSAEKARADDEKLISFVNRSTLSSMDEALYKQGKGVKAARDWLKSEYQRYSDACGGCMKVELLTFTNPPAPRIAQPTEISDVYAVLPGTDPVLAKHIYLVTGHYDSRNSTNENTTAPAPGANDDASGTIVSLECARVLSKHRFPATIIFLTVAGEEQGLNGSDYFAKWAKGQGWQIDGALNNDIVGGNRTPGDTGQNPQVVRVFSEGLPITATEQEARMIRMIGAENDSPSRELARKIVEVGSEWMPESFQPKMIFRQDRFLRGGDHISFNKQGYAAVRFTEWREDFNHQHQDLRTENGVEYGDLEKFVDFDYLANVARLNALTLATLAMAPPPPGHVRVLTKQLENTTTLEWDAAEKPGSGAPVGYEVVWRDTTAANWEHAKYVGGVTRATLDESKDNVIVGVRSVSSTGFKSYAVIPFPER